MKPAQLLAGKDPTPYIPTNEFRGFMELLW
jgi:hypothetical protein